MKKFVKRMEKEARSGLANIALSVTGQAAQSALCAEETSLHCPD